MTPETNNEIAPAIPNQTPETQPNNLLRRIAIGATALAIAGGATEISTNAIDAEARASMGVEPAVAVNSNTTRNYLNAEADQSSSLKQQCVQAGLRMPRISRAIVNRPGDRKKQSIQSTVNYRPMPEECHEVYRRIPRAKFQIQNPKNHKKWYNVIPFSPPLLFDPEPEANSLRVGDDGGLAGVSFSPFPFEIRNNWQRYRCTPGKGVTHVRGIYKNKIKEAESGKIIAQRVKKAPIKVRPIKPGTDYNGAVKRAC